MKVMRILVGAYGDTPLRKPHQKSAFALNLGGVGRRFGHIHQSANPARE
jgi:hypothetical protein